MKYLKILFPGLLLWFCISISFYILSFVPLVNSSYKLQVALVMMLTVIYTNEIAKFYYKDDQRFHGLVIGLIMSITALLLDILITIPFIEIPSGRNYQSFFSNPVVWILCALNIITVYFYWRNKVKIKLK
ncbi:DUF5367 family protein [Pseudomonas shirazensis]